VPKTTLVCILLILSLSACAPSPAAIAAAAQETISLYTPLPTQTDRPTYTPPATLRSWPTYTVVPTYTSYPTYTPIPTYTPWFIFITATFTPSPKYTATPIGTPTNTPTSTISPTPFSTVGCKKLLINLTTTTTDDQIDAQLNAYDGQCVILFYLPHTGDAPTLIGFDFILDFKATIKVDNKNPYVKDFSNNTSYAKLWGIFTSKPNQDRSTLDLRKYEVQPKNQSPITQEGLYAVGATGEMAPGVWKSGQLSTWADDCYWARINPSTGAIKDNHFGIGGISIRVYEGDVFETNKNCLSWYYTGP
jgi:hypothetical protein